MKHRVAFIGGGRGGGGLLRPAPHDVVLCSMLQNTLPVQSASSAKQALCAHPFDCHMNNATTMPVT